MQDEGKTREQLLSELRELRHSVTHVELVQAEQERVRAVLQASEEKCKRIFAESPIGIELYNAEGRLLEVNDACLDLFGVVNIGEIKGFRLFEDPNLPPAAIEKLRAGETLRMEMPFDFEKVKAAGLYQTTKSGLHHLLVLISPLSGQGRDAAGGFLVQVQDMTRYKQAEEALRTRTVELGERMKELNCLLGISRVAERPDVSWEHKVQSIVDLLPPSWQYPETACARILLENQEYTTANFSETAWKMTQDIIVHGEPRGSVEIYYLEDMPQEYEGPFLREERRLINAIAERLEGMIEHKQSQESIRQLSQRLLKAQEIERQRIAADLHDHLAQDLSTLKIRLDTLFDQQPNIPEPVKQQVAKLASVVQHSVGTVRNLAYALHPAGLERFGLVRTIHRYCEDFAATYSHKVEFFSIGMEGHKLDFDTQIIIFRLIQEGLNNVRKHAEASHVIVRLSASHPYLLLRIEDNGQGFDPQRRLDTALRDKRLGIQSMQQRVALLNGVLKIDSKPQQGTKILIRIPSGGQADECKDHNLDR